jgi:AGZA family xanthine/uracil permease-like MFS transporter
VAWAASPQVALGYLFFGIVCAAYSFLPGAKDPVTFDEADVVAGH